jgi:hypothetical protein
MRCIPDKYLLCRALVVVLALGCASLVTRAGPEDIVLGTGVEGGSYWQAGGRLQAVASEMGLEVERIASEGSLENLDNLLNEDSPVNLAFVQADALQLHLNRYPRDRRKIEILEKIGQQCLFFVTGLKSDFDDADDLGDDGAGLGIANVATGASLSLDYINSRQGQFESVDVIYGDFERLAQQLYKSDNAVDALLMLSAPREYADNFQYVLDNPHRYRVLDFENDDLTEALPDGRRIYREMRLVLPGASKPVNTLCVSGMLVSNRQKMSPRQRNRLTDLVSYYWMRVYATSRN